MFGSPTLIVRTIQQQHRAYRRKQSCVRKLILNKPVDFQPACHVLFLRFSRESHGIERNAMAHQPIHSVFIYLAIPKPVCDDVNPQPIAARSVNNDLRAPELREGCERTQGFRTADATALAGLEHKFSRFSDTMCFLVRRMRCWVREKRTSCGTMSPITPSKSHPTTDPALNFIANSWDFLLLCESN